MCKILYSLKHEKGMKRLFNNFWNVFVLWINSQHSKYVNVKYINDILNSEDFNKKEKKEIKGNRVKKVKFCIYNRANYNQTHKKKTDEMILDIFYEVFQNISAVVGAGASWIKKIIL